MLRVPLIAITGIGMITPLGITAPANWGNLLNGESGVDLISKFDASGCQTRIGGQLPPSYFEIEKKSFNRHSFKQTIRVTRIAKLAAKEAVEDSGLNLSAVDLKRCGVVLGTSGAGLDSDDDKIAGSQTYRIIREMANAAPARISLDFGFQGPSYTLTASSESGVCAISNAFDMIRWGRADVVIAGGVDTLLTQNFVRRFNHYNLLTTRNNEPKAAVKPFDLQRNGFVISDGGCILVLENAEHARLRNARIYAYITGYGTMTSSCRGHVLSDPVSEDLSAVMKMALQNSGVNPKAVGYINASGLSTKNSDRQESAGIRQAFGDHADNQLVSIHKSMIGHTMSANGAIGVAICALALKTGDIPPTINLTEPDPECNLNFVRLHRIHQINLAAAMCNSFGFDGSNWSIVIESAS